MIIFDKVTKKYGNSIAAEGISFKVDTGEFIFLVGASGAGKTTILKLINREILPTHGAVFVDDWEVDKLPKSKLPFLRRKVGFIFQDFKLLQDRTVAENIAVSLEILGRGNSDIDGRIREVLKIIQLPDKSQYFPKQLSLGEQQRVAIGRAVAGETEIILADEPTGNLDPKTSWDILKIINDINKQGKTVIMASHNVDIVDSMKKRVIEMNKGKIVRDQKKSKYS
ncbi:cell division ATP-binding protein FtsE [Candidatus Gottesmanbacteria bacterium RIFCSPLOWO2_02_FULL_42_29]|uniref:Cell division ATP-binding protein FtsE n=2 Tax=Candidatus Gottesmaniibacteriota TaxID=1752720 RepID=A0A1F6BGB0_9BACT|nr:MAG: Cell division ATP-binding protein FtsE [Candidatus Gottesmanbacteria bacterium GW2011_GWA2_42_18]KKS75769.1 MAG: Cell division ATP-binding protein FtsE [Candidatus Gottesmanbacteria bacterium GW2011_GWC2_42_8]OGG11031.1 MAG: cell division ATP-binding protein FtsE [Candidatus Gottesmanbacteria bacterium RIFCSPHIGHO2_01_FULL_42_27]OGG35431.1 MAG: cell division ATP-binding protein FtsE [Candidatus Gottesmanbacteria bacterium RIFCSPLOWO2_12_FULL_42_10]OGG35976.1 MAG: cell division ATP-bindi